MTLGEAYEIKQHFLLEMILERSNLLEKISGLDGSEEVMFDVLRALVTDIDDRIEALKNTTLLEIAAEFGGYEYDINDL